MQQLEINFNEPLEFEKLSYDKRLDLLSKIDLSFIGKNGRIPLHNLHPFPAKFPPQLPSVFIELLTNKNDKVLDPMMGSSTTLIETLRLNRKAYGCDIDPLAILIAEAKLNFIEISEILKFGKDIVTRAYKNYCNNRSKIENELIHYFDDASFKFVNYWFTKETQLELYSLIKEINELTDERLQNFLRLIFSSIIIAKSGGVSLAVDLAHTRPHLLKDKKLPSAFEEFNKKLSTITKNVSLFKEAEFKIFQADARDIPIENKSIDLIVTSPPYANNAIDYLRAHKFSLVWFGNTLKYISEIRNIFIGSNSSKNDGSTSLPKRCEKIINELKKKDNSKANSLNRYYNEMYEVIKEMHRVLKKNKTLVVVVATSNIKGVDSETHTCLSEIGILVGFKLIGINKRLLDRDRRMMPTRWNQNKNSQIESRMHEEYVIIFQKV